LFATTLAQPLDTAALVRAHAASLWRALRRMGVREADVEDMCQEVFLVAYRRRNDFEGRSSVRTWLYGIAARVAADYRKRASHRHETQSDSVSEEGAGGQQEETVARQQARAMLDALLDDLDSDKRAVFVLYEIEELSMNEVASALGCPLQTAYSRLHAARARVADGVKRMREKGGVP
jgi:RNA polymerase sigma-70 factor (ECF subfamily)